jgi:hypothetical protein
MSDNHHLLMSFQLIGAENKDTEIKLSVPNKQKLYTSVLFFHLLFDFSFFPSFLSYEKIKYISVQLSVHDNKMEVLTRSVYYNLSHLLVG